MRHLRRRKELNLSKIVILFVISITTFSVGYSLLSQNLSVEGTANLITQIEDTKEFNSKNLNLKYDDKSWYNGGDKYTYFQYDFTLSNIGNQTVENWKIVIEFSADVVYTGGWSAKYEVDGNKIIITGIDWNSNLAPSNQITFGLQLNTSDSELKIVKVELS